MEKDFVATENAGEQKWLVPDKSREKRTKGPDQTADKREGEKLPSAGARDREPSEKKIFSWPSRFYSTPVRWEAIESKLKKDSKSYRTEA